MTYTAAVNTIFSAISCIILLLFAHYAVLALFGVFGCKKYPHAEHKNRYGIIVPAKNEETVIKALIESVRNADYPQELIDIFVVAHNCTDRTAELARQNGAIVYEYDNPDENTMGYAFRYLFGMIERDCKTASYDGFFIVNADNTFAPDYFEKMNDAFEYYDRKYVISAFRQASNFNENLMAEMYGVYFAISCYLGARGRTLLGLSNRIFGCGYLISSELVKDGWNYVSLTEDIEFTASEFLKETGFRYCDEAVFYDEQPTTLRIMWRQRLRWERGMLFVSEAHLGSCIKAIFEPGRKNRFAVFDMATFISRVILVLIFLFLLRTLLLCFAPVFGESLKDAFFYWDSTKSWWQNIFVSTDKGLIFSLANGIITGYVAAAVTYVMTMFAGRKRFYMVSPGKVIAGFFLFPIFLHSQFVLDVQALFSRNLTWKQIPHTGNQDKR